MNAPGEQRGLFWRDMLTLGTRAFGYSDEEFKRRLDQGHPWQEYVALFLRLHRIEAEAGAYRFRAHVDEVGEYSAHEHDIWLPKLRLHLDVKTRREAWHGMHDYPYPDVFVDTASSWKAKRDKPFAYVIVSRPTGAMLVVPADSAPRWRASKKRDHQRGISDYFLSASLQDVRDMAWLVRGLTNRFDS